MIQCRVTAEIYQCRKKRCCSLPEITLSPDFFHELKKRFTGDLRTDSASKALYSTDASIYQIDPLGVAIPKTQDDLQSAVELAAKYKDEFIDIRRHIHSHPELSYEEFETSKFVQQKLAGFGIEVLNLVPSQSSPASNLSSPQYGPQTG